MSGKSTVIKAVQRLGWRFQKACEKDNTFKINPNDIDALQIVADYVEGSQKRQYANNELFAKLYIHIFKSILKARKETVFENSAAKMIGAVLQRPIEQCVEDLVQSLNDNEAYAIIDKSKVPDGVIPEEISHLHIDHLKNLIEHSDMPDKLKAKKIIELKAERKRYNERFIELAEKYPEAITSAVWDYETVSVAVTAEINNMINLYS